jgi:hypothetical protein
MKVKTLIKNERAYRGQFVATSTFNDRNVIAHGTDPRKVMKQAERKAESPVVFFIPDKNVTHIY